MAKHTLEFDFYEDRDELDLILHCKDAYNALWDIQQMVHAKMNMTAEDDPNYKFYESISQLTYGPLEYYR